MSVQDIEKAVALRLKGASGSSIRSYLRLNTPQIFSRPTRSHYHLREQASFTYADVQSESVEDPPEFRFGRSCLIHDDCFGWLKRREPKSIHAVVTDPPYGLVEYSYEQQRKLRAGRGGVWRIPPSFDGAKRSPLPRFTILKSSDLDDLQSFFTTWGRLLLPALVPGASVLVASNPLLSYVVAGALSKAGLERRGEIVRLTMTMRGGDRPKAAHEEFNEVSVMPRSMWEPWLVFRKPVEGRVQDNLRTWKTGGFRRPSPEQPFGDVIHSQPTRAKERSLAPHPSLKPQDFLRKLVRAVLPLGEGVVLDPFAGSGSTLAAAEAVGYESIGIEQDAHYFRLACSAVPALAALRIGAPPNDKPSSVAK
jgi:site-specific DNA-methyltransferase (adenine-specific)